MYAAQLRQKPEFKHLSKTPHLLKQYSKAQMHQLENLKRELEVKQARTQSTALRNKTLQYRDKVNYQNELDKIRGYLSQRDTRLPIGTIERLHRREEELKKLGAKIAN